MYSAFGPMMFSCKDGRMSDFGSISYLSGTRTARFIRVSDTTSVGALSHFLEKFWRLPRPDVLLSVTGSAASLQLTSTLQRVFDRGLATAAAMTNAWIFTGGTDSGVMKLVGDAMHKGGLVDVPLVGIAPFRALHGKAGLAGKKGQEVHVACTRPARSAREPRVACKRVEMICVRLRVRVRACAHAQTRRPRRMADSTLITPTRSSWTQVGTRRNGARRLG